MGIVDVQLLVMDDRTGSCSSETGHQYVSLLTHTGNIVIMCH